MSQNKDSKEHLTGNNNLDFRQNFKKILTLQNNTPRKT
jgi:hypothetical protein